MSVPAYHPSLVYIDLYLNLGNRIEFIPLYNLEPCTIRANCKGLLAAVAGKAVGGSLVPLGNCRRGLVMKTGQRPSQN